MEAKAAAEATRDDDTWGEQDAAKAHQVEVLAITRAEQAQASAAEETARIRADHQCALDQPTAATDARIKAVEETRDAPGHAGSIPVIRSTR